ncbi:MAG TPA: hypothetical protein VGL72_09325 [Bryobacteraceae bacterium]
MSWIDAIALNRNLIENGQTELAVIVSGSATDSAFWAQTVEKLKRDTLRQDGRVGIVSLAEEQPLGNFLGTVNAWMGLTRRITAPTQGVSLLNMVFGKGKRFSPFTQALGNRKAAFPTPLRAKHSDSYLRTGDLATLYSNSWLDQLRSRGFNGILIKWGDEAVIPSLKWDPAERDFSEIDLVRFVWKTAPTEVLAREKEWFVINEESGLIERLIPRQKLASLTEALRGYEGRRFSTAVNLGSIAVSYRFLSLAAELFGEMLDGGTVSADWDPYAMLLLLGGTAADSETIAAGIAQAEARCPGLVSKIGQLRQRIERSLGRPVRSGFLDFGDAFWVDIGLHSTLRKCLESLTSEDRVGQATRAFFDIPDQRDARGNIVVGGSIPEGSNITDSVVINSTILDPKSTLRRAVVVGSRHGHLSMPSGGASLFSAVADLQFDGENGIAFRAIADSLRLPAGARYTSLFLDNQTVPLQSNESIRAYDDAEYSQPVLGNAMSFEEAGNVVGAIDPAQLQARWKTAWTEARIG